MRKATYLTNDRNSLMSDAVTVHGFVYASGQVGRRDDGSIPEGIGPQLEQAVANLSRVLERADSDLSHILKITAFVTADGWREAFNETYRRCLPHPLPARTRVQVAGLAPGYLVELDVVAYQREVAR